MDNPITLRTPLSALSGVGPARQKALLKLGLETVADLLAYFPRDYEDRTVQHDISALPLEEPVCFAALVAEPFRTSYIRRGMELTQGRIVDGTSTVYVTFFNQSYIRSALTPGETYHFYGRLTRNGNRLQISNPHFEKEGENRLTGGIMPVYPLTAGITGHLIASLQRQASACADQILETLPEDLRRAYALAPAEFSYREIHFPTGWDSLEKARRRLMFEELFCLTLGLTLLRGRRGTQKAAAFVRQDIDAFTNALPFSLTDAQLRSLREAAADLAKPVPMNRLLQGDVGSGKTVVAAACAWLAKENGRQSALMAPTELLARQHARTLTDLLSPLGMTVDLLTGSMTAKQKRLCRERLESGETDLIVGTHALLSDPVDFARLGLVITDEQHRFGVDQRAALTAKAGGEGVRPHVLVMSATPIPRTLALMIYGDLDLSVIDQLPPGRTPVETFLIGEDKRQRLYDFVRKLAGQGRQVYIVCPAVDQEDPEGMKAAEQYGHKLRTQVFPDLRVGIVHGRQKPKEKNAVMSAFAAGELDVLVSTTVIEVGVDVPNAALMVIEDADRFGLSQLHQLRGRVGRGKHQSYCVLLSSNRAESTRRRLKTLCSTTDGFLIAEEDLKIRGPGDFFGSRQHGLPQLKLASLEGDMRLLHQAQAAAREVLREDPDLRREDHAPLRKRVEDLFRENRDIFN